VCNEAQDIFESIRSFIRGKSDRPGSEIGRTGLLSQDGQRGCQITGRESGQAANNNYPKQSGSGQGAD